MYAALVRNAVRPGFVAWLIRVSSAISGWFRGLLAFTGFLLNVLSWLIRVSRVLIEFSFVGD